MGCFSSHKSPELRSDLFICPPQVQRLTVELLCEGYIPWRSSLLGDVPSGKEVPTTACCRINLAENRPLVF